MTTTMATKKSKTAIYLMLALILAACVWAGWHDFDLRIPQEIVRENIRAGIRGTIQLAVQYFIPINILVYFAQEIVAGRKMKLKDESAIAAS